MTRKTAIYLIPALFAFTPLITGSWTERIIVFVFACFGLYALAGILQWHLEERLTIATGLLLLISAACLLWAPFGIGADHRRRALDDVAHVAACARP